MYRDVALEPRGDYHFEMGRPLAERLGYEPFDRDRIPPEAIESFAGVGYFFDLADIQEGETVLDLGSGAGMDSFIAAPKVGPRGAVTGIDMTREQLEKATDLEKKKKFGNVTFVRGNIEDLPFADDAFDVVISNGVVNLCNDKEAVFREVGRVLKHGGRLAIADIVTGKQLSDNIVCDANLWASCIGGAAQQDAYQRMIEEGRMKVTLGKKNDAYAFLSKSARGATETYGVKSVSLLAENE